MKTVYVLLSRSNTFCARMIRCMTSCRYNHVSIALDRGLSPLYSFARRKINNPLIGGFIAENIHTGIFGKNGEQPCALYEMQIEDTAYEKLTERIERYLRDYDSYRYNFLGVPLCYLGIPLERKHHFLCSQFVASMLGDTDACTLPRPVSLMQPMDFTDVPELRLVYSGPLAGVSARGISQEAEASAHT